MFLRVCQLKNYENRSIFGEDMEKSLMTRFFDSRCIIGLFGIDNITQWVRPNFPLLVNSDCKKSCSRQWNI